MGIASPPLFACDLKPQRKPRTGGVEQEFSNFCLRDEQNLL